jgi:hypothetical protein
MDMCYTKPSRADPPRYHSSEPLVSCPSAAPDYRITLNAFQLRGLIWPSSAVSDGGQISLLQSSLIFPISIRYSCNHGHLDKTSAKLYPKEQLFQTPSNSTMKVHFFLWLCAIFAAATQALYCQYTLLQDTTWNTPAHFYSYSSRRRSVCSLYHQHNGKTTVDQFVSNRLVYFLEAFNTDLTRCRACEVFFPRAEPSLNWHKFSIVQLCTSQCTPRSI